MLVDPYAEVVFCSDGTMTAIHPRQRDRLQGQGLVMFTGGRWRTELNARELAEAVEAMPLCDVCSSDQVRWRFPARDFEHPRIDDGFPQQLSLAEWAACERCGHLILSGNIDRLAMRATRAVCAEHPELAGVDVTPLVEYLRDLYRRFVAARAGPPVRL